MDRYNDFLKEFDDTYKELLETTDDNTDNVHICCGYLIGLIKALQLLGLSDFNDDFDAEMNKRINLLRWWGILNDSEIYIN